MRRATKKIIITSFVIILLSSLGCGIFWTLRMKQLTFDEPKFNSPLAPALEIFVYNQSQHNDPVKGCWYDSGDYIVFLHRNTESLYYLSHAYAKSTREDVKNDLLLVINQQLECVKKMLLRNEKQYRDQRSHSHHLFPPNFKKQTLADEIYQFKADEGKDVHLLLSMVYQNINKLEMSKEHLEKAKNLKHSTTSENCCEEGKIQFNKNQMAGLEKLGTSQEVDRDKHDDLWGANFIALAHLKAGHQNILGRMLQAVWEDWENDAPDFDYIGGNYDIAGTIALEKLYAEEFSDNTYKDLSDQLWEYLRGKNVYDVNFTNYQPIYHPCHFFRKCELKATLINGRDEKGFEIDRKDIWRNTEVQLVGQAEYVLARVLYENW